VVIPALALSPKCRCHIVHECDDPSASRRTCGCGVGSGDPPSGSSTRSSDSETQVFGAPATTVATPLQYALRTGSGFQANIEF